MIHDSPLCVCVCVCDPSSNAASGSAFHSSSRSFSSDERGAFKVERFNAAADWEAEAEEEFIANGWNSVMNDLSHK